MDDEAAILAGLRADPADAVARLVYADWLEERGDPRAEFVRASCRVTDDLRRLAELRPGLPADWSAVADAFTPNLHVVRAPRNECGSDVVTVRRVHAPPGARVRAGDPVADVETDKAAVELLADADGVVLIVLAAAGGTVPPGGALAVLLRG